MGSRGTGGLVIVAAGLIALVSAKPTAGSWQDASRLAMVEALVDYHTWAIDDSIFVTPTSGHDPFDPDLPILQKGTQDKLFIDGHYYSDKPVFALLLAGVYQLWQWCGGPTAWQRPDLFCWLMTVAGSGFPYVVAVGCIHRLGGILWGTPPGAPVRGPGTPGGVPHATRLVLTASFALATLALTYTRQVNVHITLLAILAGITLGVVRLREGEAPAEPDTAARQEPRPPMPRRTPWAWLAALGCLAGLGYTLDLGAGPPLVLGLVALVTWRCRRIGPVVVTALAALPWILLHQAINYHIGGTFRPINSVPEFSMWPGCPFPPEALTGTPKHDVGSFLVYAAGMLLGKRGFIFHNLPLLLAVPGLFVLLRRRAALWPELLFLAGWCIATWLMYALLSNNYAGVCASVRWFVPFLAPAYLVIGLILREWPDRRRDLLVLSGWGAVMCGLAWWYGPWIGHMVPGYWPIVGLALLSWWAVHQSRKRKRRMESSIDVPSPRRAA